MNFSNKTAIGVNTAGYNSIIYGSVANFGSGHDLKTNYPNLICQFVFPLETPIEIDLTPTQINSLLGSNNIWHDGNGDIELKFKETIQDWIDQQ